MISKVLSHVKSKVCVVELELLGVHEIAEMLGVSRQRVNELARSSLGFPKPVARLAAGRIWLKEDVEKWAATWERRSGRPRRGASG